MIVSMLDLSTAHIREETAMFLGRQVYADQPELVVYEKSAFGWVIPIPELDFELMDSIPADLYSILTYAKGLECHWLMIDQDAEQIEHLPTCTW